MSRTGALIKKVWREIALVGGLSLGLFAVGEVVSNLLPAAGSEPQAASLESAKKPDSTGKVPISKDPVLMLPALNVQAPIVFGHSTNESAIIEELRRGVSHRAGTPAPGAEGNVFIAGHSSNFPWEKGGYNRVFASLSRLSSGDVAIVDYNGKRYVYSAVEKRIVEANEVSVMAPMDGRNLTLMTCYPTGLSTKRLIVRFKLANIYGP